MDRAFLMPIGTFASATQLSAKALRLYADNGLLIPAFVDDATGYRYYRPEQVHDARLVRVLRDMDMPLAAIAHCIAQPEKLASVAAQHMDALARTFNQQRAAHQTLRGMLAPTRTAAAQISMRAMAGATVATQVFSADTRSLHTRTRHALTQLQAQTSPGLLDAATLYVYFTDPPLHTEETSMELCVPLAAHASTMQLSQLSTRHHPDMQVACIDLALNDDVLDFAAATDALFDWFDRQGKTLHGQPFALLHRENFQLAWPLAPH
jgi:DNA-binding transcriptional MerR regulator